MISSKDCYVLLTRQSDVIFDTEWRITLKFYSSIIYEGYCLLEGNTNLFPR
jgi:hypothetical protein